MKKSYNFFKNRREIFLFVFSFIFALAFFIWQRQFFSWDFSVYLMNSEYFNLGHYFEWLRPPFVPFLLYLFGFFGRQATMYLFTVFCTILYFISLKFFHDKFLVKYKNSEIIYLLAINPFILKYGTGVGTELLSLSLIILFVVFSFSKSSSLFLGLSMLTRYSNLFLFPLLFLSKNWKKILLGLFIIFLLFLPWFIFNYINTGHALTSLGDYYALNSLEQARPQLGLDRFGIDFILAANILLPFLIIGLFIYFKSKKEDKNNKLAFLLLSISILVIFTYLFNSIKDQRFLFNLSLPIVYFSFIGINWLIEKCKNDYKKPLHLIILIILILGSASSFISMGILGEEIKREEAMLIEIKEKADNCTISSDMWIYFNWYDKIARPEPKWRPTINDGLPEIFSMTDDGYNIILFKNSEAYLVNKESIGNLSQYILEDNEKYIWVRNNATCRIDQKIESTYFESMKVVGEFSEDFTGCDALLLKLNLRTLCKTFPFL